MLRIISLFCLSLFCVSLLAQETQKFKPDQQGVSKTWCKLSDNELRAALKKGGLIFVFRHARTDWTFKEDATKVELDNRETQRNLSKEGDAQAQEIGRLLKHLHVKFSEIYSSAMFRAKETAKLLAGEPEIDQCWMGIDAVMRKKAALVLGTIPKSEKCVCIVTHGTNIEKQFSQFKQNEVEEGNCVIVRPLGDSKFEAIGHLSLKDWQRLGSADSN